MPSLSRRLELLASVDDDSAAAILAGALGRATSDELRPLAEAALELATPTTFVALLRHLDRLGEAGPALVARAARDERKRSGLDQAIAAVLASSSAAVAVDVARVIGRSEDAGLAHHLPRILELSNERAQGVAADALVAVVADIIGPNGAGGTRLERGQLDQAVVAAARQYRRHRQDAVLLATALLANRPPPRLDALLDEDEALAGWLRRVPDQIGLSLVRRNLVRWLASPVLGRASARRLSRIEGLEAIADTLEDGHLLLAPLRREAFVVVDRPKRLLPSLDLAGQLSPRVQAQLPRLVRRLDLLPRARCGYLADFIAIPSPIARWRAVRELNLEAPARTRDALAMFAFDVDAAVAAEAAAPIFVGRSSSGDDLLRRLEGGGHAPLMRRAGWSLASRDPFELLARISVLPEPLVGALARKLLREDRASMLAAVAGVLAGGEAGARCRAISLVRRLSIAAELDEVIGHLIDEPDVRVASAAITLLPETRHPDRNHRLETALARDDDRVRANAIEVLPRIASPDETERMLPRFLGHDDNRCRANAVRAMLRTAADEGGRALQSMLRDPRPRHRVSAIWVARRARVSRLRHEVERIASEDPVLEIRVRAWSADRQLYEHSRSGGGAPS